MQWCHLLVEQYAHPGTLESPVSAEHLQTAMLQFPAHLDKHSIFKHEDKLLTNITKANFVLLTKDYE
jgi:hypothetical protein